MPTELQKEGQKESRHESSPKVNFAQIFPQSPPPFRVTSTLLPTQFFQERPASAHPRVKSTVQLHNERIQASEKLLGDAFSESAKNFIGSTDTKIWKNSDAFGMRRSDDGVSSGKTVTLSSTPKKTESPQLKSILKTSSSAAAGAVTNQIQPSKTCSRKKSLPSAIGPLGDLGRVGSRRCQKSKRQVTFDISTKDSPPPMTLHDLLMYNTLKLDKEPGVAKLRLKSPPPKLQKAQRGSTNEDLKVVHGYAFFVSDADKNTPNTFANTQTTQRVNQGSVVREPFYKEVNMEGFLDSELSFQTDDTSLVVTGLRPNRNDLNARKVSEVIEFPEGVYHETLLISRDRSGVLTIQQYML